MAMNPRYNPRDPRGYRPARVPLGMSPEGAGTFAKWDSDRRDSKEADAQARRAAAYSAIAEQEARERGVVLAPSGAPEPVRIPAKIGMMSSVPMGGAAKKAWKLRSAERSLRKSGWLKGPTIIKSNRGRKRRSKSTRSRPRHRNGQFKKLHRARRSARKNSQYTRARRAWGRHEDRYPAGLGERQLREWRKRGKSLRARMQKLFKRGLNPLPRQTRCRVCGGFHSPKCRPLSRKQEASIWRGILAKKRAKNLSKRKRR